VKVRRIVDLLDTDGRVLGFKDGLQAAEWSLGRTQSATDNLRDDHARGRRPVSAGHGHQKQAGTGGAASYQVGAEDRRFADALCPMVQESIRDGIYPPHRSRPMCSRRYCGYWLECEHEFGGRVADQLRARVYATDSRIPSRFHLMAADPR